MHGVSTDFPVNMGPIEIRTGAISLDAKLDAQGPDPAIKSFKYWLQSPAGIVRYYSPDHTKVVWEGKYRELRLIALTSSAAEGKNHVSIPVGSLWVSSLSVENAPAVMPLMGSDVSLPRLVGGFWNVAAIEADFNAKGDKSSHAGRVRFIDSQSVTLRAAKLPCRAASLTRHLRSCRFLKVPKSFDFKLGEAGLELS